MFKLIKFAFSLAPWLLIAFIGLWLYGSAGHLSLTGLTGIDATTETTAAPVKAEYRIEAVDLHCHARLTATIPVTLTRTHELAGFGYRTDTVNVTAVGDVETCVEGDGHQIVVTESGSAMVRVPAESIIVSHRPRVDMDLATIEADKGWVGQWTDAYPFVDDDMGLTGPALALTQRIVSVDCTRAAFEETWGLVVAAYVEQAVAQGVDPGSVSVQVVGDIVMPEPLSPAEFDAEFGDDLGFSVGAVDCSRG